MEIHLTDPEIILAPRTQHKPDSINDGSFAGIILSHQCRDAGRQGQSKRGVPFAKSSEVLDPYFGQPHMSSPEGPLRYIPPMKP
jgi:hypothetical protein